MNAHVSSPSPTSRRRFLRQSLAFSALAALGSSPGISAALPPDPSGAELLMVGDWGYDDDHAAQSGVAAGMRQYVSHESLNTQALLFLGDNWYGDLTGGVHSPRWQAQFEEMYPTDVFACPAYAIPGNHDYQRWPESKVAAELEYARVGKNRQWFDPLDHALALVSVRVPGETSIDYVPCTRQQHALCGRHHESWTRLHSDGAAAGGPACVARSRAKAAACYTFSCRDGTPSCLFGWPAWRS